ncbi:PREDICTED: basic helix-loop-helix transcription factor scleraxis [Vollenhovia emeryi]|uniref:basic helix-loop-helix transcription factor scleraxis n=1 Tax=Vollenhovia emeryi TaxID=411798 RepID=UPI0005F3EAE3|nr:PREDICTED: basic helix-loop-helix transcription factor scleraxis [Vollenhovia emeryi]
MRVESKAPILIERLRGVQVRKSEDTRSSLCSVNTAFSALRTLIPTEPADRKLSKIETLRLASSYISHLDAMLVAGAIDQPCTRLSESGGACPRPRVCTFCLAMHKRYSFDISQGGIPGYSNEEAKPCVYVPASATCFDLNANDI